MFSMYVSRKKGSAVCIRFHFPYNDNYWCFTADVAAVIVLINDKQIILSNSFSLNQKIIFSTTVTFTGCNFIQSVLVLYVTQTQQSINTSAIILLVTIAVGCIAVWIAFVSQMMPAKRFAGLGKPYPRVASPAK